MASTKLLTKQRTALELNRLFEVATYNSSNENVTHNTFSRFDYYKARVKVGDDLFSCVLNVGTAKSDGLLQLYDVNQFTLLKKEAPTQSNEQTTSANSLESLRSASSVNSISKNGEKVNSKKGNSVKIIVFQTAPHEYPH